MKLSREKNYKTDLLPIRCSRQEGEEIKIYSNLEEGKRQEGKVSTCAKLIRHRTGNSRVLRVNFYVNIFAYLLINWFSNRLAADTIKAEAIATNFFYARIVDVVAPF